MFLKNMDTTTWNVKSVNVQGMYINQTRNLERMCGGLEFGGSQGNYSAPATGYLAGIGVEKGFAVMQ